MNFLGIAIRSREKSDGVVADHVEVDLLAKQVVDFANAILDHIWSFQRQDPGSDLHAGQQAPLGRSMSERNMPKLPRLDTILRGGA